MDDKPPRQTWSVLNPPSQAPGASLMGTANAAEASAPPAAPQQSRSWWAGTDSRDDRSGLEMERERRASATQAGVLNDPVKSALQYGVAGAPSSSPAPVVREPGAILAGPPASSANFGPTNEFGQDKTIPPVPGNSFMTGPAPGERPTAAGGGFFNDGRAYTVQDTGEAGVSRITSGGRPNLYTNIDPGQAVQEIGAMKPSAVGPLSAMAYGGNENLQSLARPNAIRQSMIDAQPQGGSGIIRDTAKQDTQALMDKWGREDMAKKIANAPRRDQAAMIAVMNDQTARDNAALHAQTALSGQGVDRKSVV